MPPKARESAASQPPTGPRIRLPVSGSDPTPQARPWPRYAGALSPAEAREYTPFMHELIGCAFAAIRPYFLQPLRVDAKADASPVTAADRQAEQALRRLIQARYPSHAILGEEFGELAGGPYRWVLDPIDGTRAFISHCFLFGTLLALERDDGAGFLPVLGCIAHCAAGVALIGHRGGTTLYRNDGSRRAARVRPCNRLGEATVLSSSTWAAREQQGAAAIESVARAARMYRTWGDCFGYFSLATGGADVMLDPQLSYWDVAAIVPVVEGAGGAVSSWRGASPLLAPSLVATAGPLHADVLTRISDPARPVP
jgi:histidinol phosphatase-like enzyme (inositol monophosphatase family)